MDRVKEDMKDRKSIFNAVLLVYAMAAAFLCCAASMVSAEDTADEKIRLARKEVESKRYDKAIDLYKLVESALHANPGLLIEGARVYCYADKHVEAIAFFEEVRTKFPEHEKEILRELADQYKWSGNNKKAIEIYLRAKELGVGGKNLELSLAQALSWDHRNGEAVKFYDEALSREPDNVEALCGKAEVLSWMDRLEDSEKIYKDVLKKEPKRKEAREGLARVAVWQGYHRQGIARYQEILREAPDDPAAMEGLAFAYHWEGCDSESLKILDNLLLKHPERKEAGSLYKRINNSRGLHVNQSNYYSADSNHLAIESYTFHLAKHFADFMTVGGLYDHHNYRQPGRLPVEVDRVGLDLNHRASDLIEMNSYLYRAYFDRPDFSPFLTNSWLTLYPDDRLRFDFGFNRETIDDIQSIEKKILVNSASVSGDFRPNRFWLFSTSFRRGKYSDGNTQDTFFSKIEYRLLQDPYVKIYYNNYYSDFKLVKDNGYFNPRAIQSNTAGVYFSRRFFDRFFVETQLGGGYEAQNPKSNHPVFSTTSSLEYRINNQWAASLHGEYFNAHDSSKDKFYQKRAIWLSFSYSLEAEPSQSTGASQAQRPT